MLDDSNLDWDIMPGIRHIRGGILGPSPRGVVKRSKISSHSPFSPGVTSRESTT